MLDFVSLLFLFLLSTFFLLLVLFLSTWLGPKVNSDVKGQPFECGVIGVDQNKARFCISFYIIAALFVLFDIEIVLLYPWVVNAIRLGWNGYRIVLSFVSVLGVGLLYVLKRGALGI